jgi:hypothetical protein
MVQVIVALALLLAQTQAQGFVLLAGPAKARLPISQAEPQVTFLVSPDHPALEDKDEFLGGKYADLSDEDFWYAMINEAMARWNDVPGAYVEMVAEPSDAAVIDPTDQVYSITIGSLGATAAAAASPEVEEKTIVDCDIRVKDTKTKAKSLAFTLMHELGHCLGLGHNHSDYNSVMGYSRTSQALYLGADDKAGVIYLYGTSDKPPEELISCGTIAGHDRDNATNTIFALMLFLPAGLVLVRRFGRRRI